MEGLALHPPVCLLYTPSRRPSILAVMHSDKIFHGDISVLISADLGDQGRRSVIRFTRSLCKRQKNEMSPQSVRLSALLALRYILGRFFFTGFLCRVKPTTNDSILFKFVSCLPLFHFICFPVPFTILVRHSSSFVFLTPSSPSLLFFLPPLRPSQPP